jgi:hypothetical protein
MERIMKNVLTTIFIFVYLLSSFGFAGVQHYCHMMQKSIDAIAGDCCCAVNSKKAHCESPEQEAQSCCSTSDANLPLQSDLFFSADHSLCCEIHHSYNQIDTSPLSQNISADSDAAAMPIDSIDAFEFEHFADFLKSAFISDPSTHLNLPLII